MVISGAGTLSFQLWEAVIRKVDLIPYLQPRVIADGFLNTERFLIAWGEKALRGRDGNVCLFHLQGERFPCWGWKCLCLET